MNKKEYFNGKCPSFKKGREFNVRVYIHKSNRYNQDQEVVLVINDQEFPMDGYQASTISNLLKQACQENMGFYCSGNVSVNRERE